MSQKTNKEIGDSSLSGTQTPSPLYPTSNSQEIEKGNLQQSLGDSPLNLETERNGIFFQPSILLSDRDRDLVLSTLENPPPLNARLKLAIRNFRQKYAK